MSVVERRKESFKVSALTYLEQPYTLREVGRQVSRRQRITVSKDRTVEVSGLAFNPSIGIDNIGQYAKATVTLHAFCVNEAKRALTLRVFTTLECTHPIA